jgi:hypothetical protein
MQTPTLRLKLEPWLAINAKAGRISGRARAANLIGVDHSNLSRIERGLSVPSNGFIAAVWLAYPTKNPRYFFEAVREDAK